jgi:hypothetical protein
MTAVGIGIAYAVRSAILSAVWSFVVAKRVKGMGLRHSTLWARDKTRRERGVMFAVPHFKQRAEYLAFSHCECDYLAITAPFCARQAKRASVLLRSYFGRRALIWQICIIAHQMIFSLGFLRNTACVSTFECE